MPKATATELPNALIQLTPDFTYETSLLVTRLSGYVGILGKPFLSRVNPTVDWAANTISSPFTLSGNTLLEPAVQTDRQRGLQGATRTGGGGKQGKQRHRREPQEDRKRGE